MVEASTAAGIASVGFWVLYGLPQLYETHLVRSGQGLSLLFVLLWLLGDLCNLVGCFLTEQLPTQVYLAVWFLLYDLTLVGQIIYYDCFVGSFDKALLDPPVRESDPLIVHMEEHDGDWFMVPRPIAASAPIPQRNRLSEMSSFEDGGLSIASSFGNTPREYYSPAGSLLNTVATHTEGGLVEYGSTTLANQERSLFVFFNERTQQPERSRHPNTPVSMVGMCLLVSASLLVGTQAVRWQLQAGTDMHATGRVLLALGKPKPEGGLCVGEDYGECMVGFGLGWVSAAIYLFGRVPQLVKNCVRRSCKMVGIASFVLWCGLFGNMCYAIAILLWSTEWIDLQEKVPWLVGSLGCIPLDLAILCQYMAYGQGNSDY
eukprot:comp44893_c0_seq1/m.47526 comp44893_c0_seq1/g.47526  ORF comp44893_c0_seq1/g.47526 comp44893_c0_seq1/m.47526 type:complete len:374 (-) comp44893_c0_seq1:395-1516(-)